jgi:aminoglycoside phosphotransferase (APT) family kinase protein
MYRLGEDMAARLPRIAEATAGANRERTWLPRLAPLLPLAVPAPLATGMPAEGYPWRWSVYRWRDGENPTVDSIADARPLALGLSQFVAALHRIDPTDGPPAGRGAPLAVRNLPTRAAIRALAAMVDTDAVTAAWNAALQVPPWSGAPVWVHGDLSPGNVLCRDGRLSAVIDFGSVGVGDPACDSIVAWNLLPADARGSFRDDLEVDDATWARGRGWALSIALIQLPYYRTTNPVLAAGARPTIDEILADHRSV